MATPTKPFVGRGGSRGTTTVRPPVLSAGTYKGKRRGTTKVGPTVKGGRGGR